MLPALVSFSGDPIYKNGGLADFSIGAYALPFSLCQQNMLDSNGLFLSCPKEKMLITSVQSVGLIS